MKNNQEKGFMENIYSREWKEKNAEYLQALNKFLDIVDNVNDESLKTDIIYQMLKCDAILTKIAEDNFQKVNI